MGNNRYLMGFILVGILVTSGCVDASTSDADAEPTGPQPEVVQTNSERGLMDSISGEATVTATVLNRGEAGEVRVRIEFLDANRNMIGTSRQVIYMGAGERREVDFEVALPDNAESYTISATA